MPSRHALSWKTLFYDALLPSLGQLGPATADRALQTLGRLSYAWPTRRRWINAAETRARETLKAGWHPPTVRQELAAGVFRTLARDYLLEGVSEADLDPRFEVSGFEFVQSVLQAGQGVILLGCHLGAHLAGIHWLARRDIPVKLMVQRPKHVSPTLQQWLDRDPSSTTDGPPQRDFFLRRDLDRVQAVKRVFLARDALRQGAAVYLNGDVPWPTPSAYPGRLLGVDHLFLTLWADLASITGAPVIPLFCTHRPDGRYQMRFQPPAHVGPRSEPAALATYLQQLEQEIAAHPGDAVPHLLWPTYTRAQQPASKTPSPASRHLPTSPHLPPPAATSLTP